MRKTIKHIIVLVVILMTAEMASASGITSLGIGGSVQGENGQNVDITIQADNIVDIGSLQINVAYDRNVLSGDSITAGNAIFGGLQASNIDNAMGIATIGVISTTGISGTGTLATIRFHVIGTTGQTSPMNIQVTIITQPDGNPVNTSPSVNNGLFTVVAPSQPLTIIAPANITQMATGTYTNVNLGTPTISGGVPSYNVINDAPSTGFPTGTNIVTWTVTDSISSVAKAEQSIMITPPLPQKLTIIAPTNISKVATGIYTNVNLGTPTISGGVPPYITVNDAPMSGFAIGTTIVTWTTTDSTSSIAKSEQMVTITSPLQPPMTLTIIVPTNISKVATGTYTNVNLGTPTVSGGLPPYTTTNDAPIGGFPIGNTIVTWSVTDNAGTKVTGIQIVTIIQQLIPLTIIPPPNISRPTTGTYTNTNIGTPTVSGGIPPYTIVNDAPAMGFIIGNTTVTWTVADSTNANAVGTQLVTIFQLPPPIDSLKIVAPANISQSATGTYTNVNLGTPTISGGVIPYTTTNDAPISGFQIGNTIVTWSVTDNAGITAKAEQLITINTAPISQLTIIAPANIKENATGMFTNVNLGTPVVSGGIQPYNITNDAPTNGFQIGNTTVIWTVIDGSGNSTTASQSVMIRVNKLTIIQYDPNPPTVNGNTSSSITFDVKMNKRANITWSIDGVQKQQKQNIISDSFVTNFIVGTHTLIANAQNGTESTSQTWTINIQGVLEISADPNSINIGQPTNITIKVSRTCGTELNDNCSVYNSNKIPVDGVSVSYIGIVNGSNTTPATGLFVIYNVNASVSSTINITVSKPGYASNFMQIFAGVSPIPSTDTNTNNGGNGGGGGSSGGGGGGGGGTTEPYDNILKYEIQENPVYTTAVPFKYSTPELSIYEVDIVSNQADIAALRVEVLKNTSKLVGIPAPGAIYKNINMWIDYKRIKSATILFKVDNSWIDGNELSAESIDISKWNNNSKKWNQLQTKISNKDAKYTYFSSQDDNFSSSEFAVNAINDQNNVIIETPEASITNVSNIDPTATATATLAEHKRYTGVEIGIAGIFIALVFYMIRIKKTK